MIKCGYWIEKWLSWDKYSFVKFFLGGGGLSPLWVQEVTWFASDCFIPDHLLSLLHNENCFLCEHSRPLITCALTSTMHTSRAVVSDFSLYSVWKSYFILGSLNSQCKHLRTCEPPDKALLDLLCVSLEPPLIFLKRACTSQSFFSHSELS